MMFLLVGAVSATELNNVSNTEDSNLATDNVDALSVENKLEVSSEDSISETNIVNSHDDDLNNYLDNDALKSTYEDSYGQVQTSDKVSVDEKSSDNDVLSASSSDESSSGSTKVSTKLSVSDTHYAKSATYFKVTLKDKDGKAISNQKISLKVKGKTYSAVSNSNGVASIKTKALAKGSYTVALTYAGSTSYSSSTLSKKVKVLSSISGSDITRYYGRVSKYSVTFWKNNNALANTKVSFKVNGVTYTKTTNKNGVAKLPVNLAPGKYIITVKNPYSKESVSKKYISKKDGTVLKHGSSTFMTPNKKHSFTVTLKSKHDVPIKGKKVTFKYNNKKVTAKTNAKGKATITLSGLKKGTYSISYSYSGDKFYSKSSGSSKLYVGTKQTVKLSAGDLIMDYKDGSVYKASVKDKSGNPLKNVKVKFTINGKSYTHKTDSKGIAKQSVGLNIGYYAIKTVVSDKHYKSSTVSKHVSVKGTKFVGSDLYVSPGSSVSYSVKVLNYKNNPIKGTEVSFTVDGEKYTVSTNSNGVAKVGLGVLSNGTHKITYSKDSYSGSSKIYVVNSVTIKQLIDASDNVEKYIEKNHKLPSTVNIGGVTYSTAEYMYLVSKAIINLKSGSKARILVKDIDNPSNPSSTYSSGNLNNYLAVAKSLVKSADSNGKMPNVVGSKIGKIGYNPAVYAFARVVTFYGDNHRMPSYVEIKSVSTASKSSSLNSKNTIKDLTAYLLATKNCQVNNKKIKQLVDKLTKGLKTKKQKATAIFNYVRDTISYSFYYDTKHGAVGTLKAKSGNCVDHSHLLVAMYRSAGLAARYGHGKCTFTSGGTYGHVWAQVLIGNTWKVSDATSSRNSLGKVVNWNTKSYKLYGYSSSISF
ncbi:Ig-like domain-containing protein [Methanobrevibacter sp.]|uniref:Ig-like domain-containing protein n=1 Tax=Methanobrevibacter sp. TaxID=66852 RepID=UPI00386F4138